MVAPVVGGLVAGAVGAAVGNALTDDRRSDSTVVRDEREPDGELMNRGREDGQREVGNREVLSDEERESRANTAAVASLIVGGVGVVGLIGGLLALRRLNKY